MYVLNKKRINVDQFLQEKLTIGKQLKSFKDNRKTATIQRTLVRSICNNTPKYSNIMQRTKQELRTAYPTAPPQISKRDILTSQAGTAGGEWMKSHSGLVTKIRIVKFWNYNLTESNRDKITEDELNSLFHPSEKRFFDYAVPPNYRANNPSHTTLEAEQEAENSNTIHNNVPLENNQVTYNNNEILNRYNSLLQSVEGTINYWRNTNPLICFIGRDQVESPFLTKAIDIFAHRTHSLPNFLTHYLIRVNQPYSAEENLRFIRELSSPFVKVCNSSVFCKLDNASQQNRDGWLSALPAPNNDVNTTREVRYLIGRGYTWNIQKHLLIAEGHLINELDQENNIVIRDTLNALYTAEQEAIQQQNAPT